MKTSTKYIGRKNDIMITTDYTGLLEFSFNNKIVTGIQKVIQSFIIHFFTKVNSKLISSADGTVVGESFTAMVGYTQDTIKHFVNLAAFQAFDLVKDYELESDPDDEKLSLIRLKGFSSERDRVSVSFYLETQSGADIVFVVPITLPIK